MSKPKYPTDLDVAKKFIQLHKSATDRSINFSLSLSDVKKLLSQKACYYSGMVFTQDEPLIRTIDRIDNSKGYEKGNVVACCHFVNQSKEIFIESKTSLIGKANPPKENLKQMFEKFAELLEDNHG